MRASQLKNLANLNVRWGNLTKANPATTELSWHVSVYSLVLSVSGYNISSNYGRSGLQQLSKASTRACVKQQNHSTCMFVYAMYISSQVLVITNYYVCFIIICCLDVFTFDVREELGNYM